LIPGTELKQIQGPFRADVDCATGTVTLYVEDLYASRFELIDCGAQVSAGEYRVVNKTRKNDFAVELDGGLQVHGSGHAGSPQSLTLQSADAKDLSEILSLGSTVTIRR
jgi:hypothetical protein